MAKIKPLRIDGRVPSGYSGPVYWRFRQTGLINGNGGVPAFESLDPERACRFFAAPKDGTRLPEGRSTLYVSGEFFDEDGRLRDEWRVPLKRRWKVKRRVRVEFRTGEDCAEVSERVFDALDRLEPEKHPSFPIDYEYTDGRLERRYLIFFAPESYIAERELHISANGLEPRPVGHSPYKYLAPLWMMSGHYDQFGYLDREIIEGKHWFKGQDTNHIFSPELFAEIEKFGDIFDKFTTGAPMGVAG